MFSDILLKGDFEKSCDNFFDLLKESFTNFKELLKSMYPDDDVKIQEQKQSLMNDIYGLHKSALDSRPKFDVKSYPKPQQFTQKQQQFRRN